MNFVSTQQIISLVKEHPCLWRRGCDVYRNKFSREAAWHAVCRGVEPAYDNLTEGMKIQIAQQLTKKWYNIRDTYRKSLNPNRQRPRPYLHAKELSFMESDYKKYNIPKENTAASVTSSDDTSNEDITEENHENMEDGDYEDSKKKEVFYETVEEDSNAVQDSDKLERKPVTVRTCDIPESQQIVDDKMINVLVSIMQRGEDEDRAFFNSILPHVKLLPDETRLEFRMQVMKLIKMLKWDDRTQQ